jgi:hypothetical protein
VGGFSAPSGNSSTWGHTGTSVAGVALENKDLNHQHFLGCIAQAESLYHKHTIRKETILANKLHENFEQACDRLQQTHLVSGLWGHVVD